MTKYDIVIPTFGAEEFTVRCLESIRRNTEDYRIVWVDNGSSSESRGIVMGELQHHRERLTIWFSGNLGFVKAVNAGISAGQSEFVVLQNNDTEVTPSWLGRLSAPFSDPGVMVAGPMASACGSWQAWPNVRAKLYGNMPDLSSMAQDDAASALGRHFGPLVRDAKMVAFFSTLFRRSVFDGLGLLDESMGVGLGDDDEYCHRVLDRKFGRVMFVPGAYVVHNHRTTFKKLYSEAQIKEMQSKNIGILKDRGIV